MPYIGNQHNVGDHVNNFKVLDDISSHTATFDGSATSVVSAADDTIRIPEHRFIQGQRVTYTNGGGGNIGGLTSGTAYFVSFDSSNTIKLATTLANANSNTVINLSAVGSGTSHTLNVAFDGVNTKFKMTHGSGKAARLNNATQINVAINNVIQRPNINALSFTEGFALEDNHKIVFKTAPTVNDIFWGSIIANTIENFDLRDNEVDNFTGDGSTTEFTLSTIPANNESVIVSINGVVQHPSDKNTTRSYTLIDSIIQFTAAPALGDGIQVRHIGFAGATTADVSGFYGRTGNVALTSSDHIITGDITSRNINSSGIITATTFDGAFSSNVGGSNANFTGIVTAGVFKGGDIEGRNLKITGLSTFVGDASFTGNVSIGGTLTYEDVTNIDSVGLVTAREGIFLPNDKNISLGTGNDMRIYSSAAGLNNSFIKKTGTGPLNFDFQGDFLIRNTAGSMRAKFTGPLGAVELYHSSQKKFETTSTGASVTGNFGASGNISLSGSFIMPDSLLHANDNTTRIRFPAPSTFSVDTAGSERLRIDSNGNIGVNCTPSTSGTLYDTVDHFLVIGDNDTGIAQDGDGQFEIWANQQEIINFSTAGIDPKKSILPTGAITIGSDSQPISHIYSTNITLSTKLIHDDDTDTFLEFGTNTINLNSGGTTGLTVYDTNVRIPTKLGINGATPSTPLDVIANSSGYAMALRGRSSDNIAELRFTSNDYGSALYGSIQTGATYLKISTGGQERLELDVNETTFNNPGADTDFRIRTPAQTHMFYVNAGTNQVSIKTSNAQSGAVLTVNGRTHIDTQLTLGSNSTLDAGAQATIYKPATNTLAFATAGANERLRIDNNGKVGVGDFSSGSVAQALHVKGSEPKIYLEHTGGYDMTLTTSDGMGQNGISVSGGALSLAYDNKNIWMCRAGGYVGINVTNPQALLDVGGNVDGNVQASFTRANDPNFRIQFRNESSSNNVGESQGKFGLFYASNSADICGMQFLRGSSTSAGSLIFTTGGTEKLRIKSDGIIGVNNTEPEGKGIDVAHSRTNGYAATSDTRNLAHIIARNSSDGVGRFAALSFINGGGTQAEGSINLVQTGNYTGDLTFKIRTAVSTWAERLRIQSNGRVGVGSDNPQHPLDVFGNIRSHQQTPSLYLQTTANTAESAIIRFGDAGSFQRGAIQYDFSGDNHLRFKMGGLGNNVERMTLKGTNGNLGLSVDNPDTKLHIVHANADEDVLKIEAKPVTAGTGAKSKIAFQITQSNGQSARLAEIVSHAENGWGGQLSFNVKQTNSTPNNTVDEALRIASSDSAATNLKMVVDGYLQMGGYNNTNESFVNLATLFSARDMSGSSLVSGQTDTISGYARKRTTSDGSGTFFFGPYGAFPAGDYTALFRLKVADRSGSSNVGYIDIIGNGIGIQGRNTAPRTGTGQSVNMTLQTNDFTESNKYQYFALDFSKSNSAANIETRFLSYAGNTDVYLDHVLILPRLSHGVEGVSGMFDY